MAARAEGDTETVFVVWRRVSLVLDGRLVERVSTNGACVGADVP